MGAEICKCKHTRAGHFHSQGTCMEQPGCKCLKFTLRPEFTRYEITEYNRGERMLSAAQDIYECARHFHLSHAQILENLDAKVYKSKDYVRLTPYYRRQFHGALRILAKNLYNFLEWRVFFDGRLIPGKEVPKGRWNEVVSDKARRWRGTYRQRMRPGAFAPSTTPLTSRDFCPGKQNTKASRNMARKLKPEIAYHYRGQVERGAHYEWREGYSANAEGGGSLFPWMTKRECRADAKAKGARAVFMHNGKTS